MMERNPRYRPEWTGTQKLVEWISFAAIILMWIMVIFSFMKLPAEIPVHFNASGEPDGYGDKYGFFLLPLVMTGVYALLTFTGKRPWTFNYLVRITEENYRKQYASAVNMLRMLKLCIALFSVYLTGGIIRNALGRVDGLSPYVVILLVSSILFITGYNIYCSIRNK